MQGELGPYHGDRILITGASGFVGNNLVNQMASMGAELGLVNRSYCPDFSMHRQFVGDLIDDAFINAVISDFAPHFVFHLAVCKERALTREAFVNALDSNLKATLNLFFACRGYSDLRKLVFLSTAEEYGKTSPPFDETMRETPVSAYSFSKLCSTKLALLMSSAFQLPVVTLRVSLAYGPFQGSEMFLPELINSLLQGKEFLMTAGNQTRDFLYISDLVEAMLLAGQASGVEGHIINIGSGQPVRILDVVDMVESLIGREGLIRRGALNYRENEQIQYWMDISKAGTMLGWSPKISLKHGLGQTVTWYREQQA